MPQDKMKTKDTLILPSIDQTSDEETHQSKLLLIKEKEKVNQNGRAKGTEKIFDIKLQHLQYFTEGINLNKQEKKSLESIFRSVNKSFENNKRVEILKTQKANGQNAQLSYYYQFDSWIICSKNVSIMASNQNDLKIYEGKRYTYALEIADQWFKQISRLDSQNIKKLKKFLDGYTLVGQYCGNPNYQHLIKYEEIKIIWFALIDNFSDDYCIDPFQIKKKIQEFGFSFVKIKRAGSFNNKFTFYKALQQLYLKTASASLQDSEYGMEGSIVYFISPQIKENQFYTKVLGAGKLKTIEYRFFRKIREKLSRFINRKQNEKDLLKKYEQQCKELQKCNKRSAPYPFDYYQQILKVGCELIRQTNITEQFLRSKFVTVLKLIFYAIYQSVSLNKFGRKMIRSQKFLNEIEKISFSKYECLNCNMKIIFIPVGLPKVPQSSLIKNFSKHLTVLKLSSKVISNQTDIDKIAKIIKETNQQKNPFLIHFYLDCELNSTQILALIDSIKLINQGSSIYHKFVVVKDAIDDQNNFQEDYNSYPFSIESILLSYYLVYLESRSCLRIQEKINELQIVTQQIKHKRNFDDNLNNNKSINVFSYSFAKNMNTDKQNLEEITLIVKDIFMNGKYENYCRLILKLENLYNNQKITIHEQNENDIDLQIQNLIKNSFNQIPLISIKE